MQVALIYVGGGVTALSIGVLLLAGWRLFKNEPLSDADKGQVQAAAWVLAAFLFALIIPNLHRLG